MSTSYDADRSELSANGQLSLPTMVEALVRQLRAVILAGEIKPGGRLIEERLTERFGVSRPPLREALRILQRDGLVQSLPRRGFIVVPITARDVREIYSMRMALERMAVELGVPVADIARLEPMRAAVERMRAAAQTADREELLAANSEFHVALVALADHSRLSQTYESLLMQMRLCMAFNLELRRRTESDPAESVRRHEALLGLIESGDQQAVLHELAHHGDRSVLDHLDELLGGDG
jgi:DNA-binding GntR family transcriptional regulator